MGNSWHSYPKVYALGHPAISELLLEPVVVQEKIDGSQFSFGRFGEELKIRSKGQEMHPDAPEKMFNKAVDYVKSISDKLIDGWTYRCEYLSKPKHNVLAYGKTPLNYLVLYDINNDEEAYHVYQSVFLEASRLGIDAVPLLYEGMLDKQEILAEFLERTSILGGQKIEGVVVKNYARFGKDKKALMGKYVSEAFKEIHKDEWRLANPTSGDAIEGIIKKYRTPARWNKAVQHLKERGELEQSPRDIGKLIKEARRDLIAECEPEIKEDLYKWAIGRIERASTAGISEWYKQQLLEKQFEV